MDHQAVLILVRMYCSTATADNQGEPDSAVCRVKLEKTPKRHELPIYSVFALDY